MPEDSKSAAPEWDLDYGTPMDEPSDWIHISDLEDVEDTDNLPLVRPKPQEALKLLRRRRRKTKSEESEVLRGYERMRDIVGQIYSAENGLGSTKPYREEWIEARIVTFRLERSLQATLKQILKVRPSDKLALSIDKRQREREAEAKRVKGLSNKQVLERELDTVRAMAEDDDVSPATESENSGAGGIPVWIGIGVLVSLIGYAILGTVVFGYMFFIGVRPPADYMGLTTIAFYVWAAEMSVIVLIYLSLTSNGDAVRTEGSVTPPNGDETTKALLKLSILMDLAQRNPEYAQRNMQLYQTMEMNQTLRQIRDKG